MPEFELDGKRYNNPVEFALDRIAGKWKMPILWRLKNKTWRYNELWRNMKRITHKMLAQQLKELEEDGFIKKKIYPEVPPRVEYRLTKKGKEAVPVIETLLNYGIKLMKEEKINIDNTPPQKDKTTP